ncbi:MAG: hypothetical protein LBT74_10375 [Acidobacteriota bacterium]|nr:hypothetical protein [Acidobacteriota bacterium]
MALVDGEEYPLDFDYSEDGCGCGRKDLRGIWYPDGYRVDYARDFSGRVSAVSGTDVSGGTKVYAQYVYNSELGGLSDILWGDGFVQRFEFDALGALRSNRLLRESDGSDMGWDYSYDGKRRVTRIAERVRRDGTEGGAPYDEAARFDYAYDRLGRRASATHGIFDGAAYVTDQVNSFAYDQYGNMLSSEMAYPLDGSGGWRSTYSVDAATNRLTGYKTRQDGGGVREKVLGLLAGMVPVSYDEAGNMLAEGAQSYAYDGAGRLADAGAARGSTGTTPSGGA